MRSPTTIRSAGICFATVAVLWGCAGGEDATSASSGAGGNSTGGSSGTASSAGADSGPVLEAGTDAASSAGSGGTSDQWPGTGGQSGTGTTDAGADSGTAGSGGTPGTGTQGTTCTTDGDCQFGLSCQLAVDGAALTWQCEPFVGAQYHGTVCSQDQDCRSGMCKGGFCSTPCETGADCYAEATCQVETLSLGGLDGSFGICLVTPCGSTADCGPGTVCSTVTVVGTSYVGLCRQVQPGAALGQPCTQASDCASSLCGGAGTCAEICESDLDCGGVTPMRCVDLYNNGAQTIGGCAPACGRESDCPTGTSCVIQRDTPGNRTLFACGKPLGSGAVGADCSGTIDCVAGLCLTNYYNGALVDQICTSPCSTGADCPAGYQQCVTIQMEGPAGGNISSFGVCTHP